MKKTKLLVLFWDLQIGGIQTVIRDLVTFINTTYPEVEISILLRNKTNNATTREIQQKTKARIYIAAYKGNVHVFNRFYFFVWYVYMYLKLRPDILLTFLGTFSIFTILLRPLFFWRKVKIVLNEGVVTSRYNVLNKSHVWLWNIYILLFYRFADMVIVPSVACKTDLITHFLIPEKKIQVGRNWTLMTKHWTRKKIYDLVYVGRLEKEKNVSALIELVGQLRVKFPSITLCLVGTGNEEAYLRRLITRHNLQRNILLVGYQQNVAHYYDRSKIFVTTTHNEGAPIALLEAGSQQIPVVVSRFIGSNEIVKQGKTGFIADSPEDMRVYVDRLLTDAVVRRKMGMQAEKFVQSRYGKENVGAFATYLLGL